MFDFFKKERDENDKISLENNLKNEGQESFALYLLFSKAPKFNCKNIKE